jgi:hypothetical protein
LFSNSRYSASLSATSTSWLITTCNAVKVNLWLFHCENLLTNASLFSYTIHWGHMDIIRVDGKLQGWAKWKMYFFLNLIYWMTAVHCYIIFLHSLHSIQ